MKKILFVLTIMFTMALSANAQFYAGGGLSLHNSHNSKENSFSLAVSPEIGYTFQNNTGVGCVFDFGYENNWVEPTDVTVNGVTVNGTIIHEGAVYRFGVNPYFEYDFLTVDKFTFYLHTYLRYNTSWYSGTTLEHNYGVALNPGVIWSITDHWSAAFYLGGIEYMWNQPVGKNGSGDFNFGLSASVPAGIALYYGF